MTFNKKTYAENLRDELDDFTEGMRHKISCGETIENYVFKIKYIPKTNDLAPIAVECHEYEVFHDMPDRVLEFSSTSGKRMTAKIFHEGDLSYLIRSKDFGSVEEVVSWHDAGLMISQILAMRGES
jgi:hypothetical protein